MFKNSRAALIPFICLLLIVGAGIWFWDQTAFEAWKGDLNPFAFFAFMAILPSFGAPTTPFYMIAGASFGPVVGLVGCALAIAANLLLSYFLCHSGLRPLITALLRGRKYQLPQQAPKRLLRYLLIVRLAPGFPACVKNYILVLSKVPFRWYFWFSFCFSAIYGVILFFLGDSLSEREYGQGLSMVALLALLTAVVWFARKRLNLVAGRRRL